LVRRPVTPKVGTTWLPGWATGVGTGFNLLPSIRTVKAAKLCSGFKPSGSVNVWKRTVSLSMNAGQQVRKYGEAPGPAGGGVLPEGRLVIVRWPVARSRITIWTASSPAGPGPRSVKAIRRPFGLKGIGGERVKTFPCDRSAAMGPCPTRKLGSRLAGPR